jgi:hypothetical protein
LHNRLTTRTSLPKQFEKLTDDQTKDQKAKEKARKKAVYNQRYRERTKEALKKDPTKKAVLLETDKLRQRKARWLIQNPSATPPPLTAEVNQRPNSDTKPPAIQWIQQATLVQSPFGDPPLASPAFANAATQQAASYVTVLPTTTETNQPPQPPNSSQQVAPLFAHQQPPRPNASPRTTPIASGSTLYEYASRGGQLDPARICQEDAIAEQD